MGVLSTAAGVPPVDWILEKTSGGLSAVHVFIGPTSSFLSLIMTHFEHTCCLFILVNVTATTSATATIRQPAELSHHFKMYQVDACTLFFRKCSCVVAKPVIN